MYKKIFLIISLISASIMLSGCIKYDTNIEITRNDKAIITQIYAINTNVVQTYVPNFDINNPFNNPESEEYKRIERKYKNKGYQINAYKNGDFVGREMKKTYKRAQYIKSKDLPEGISAITSQSDPVKIKKNPFWATYSIHLKLDNKKLAEISNQENKNIQNDDFITSEDKNKFASDMPESIKNIMPQMTLSIKIPKKASRHNAISFDKKKHIYRWDYTKSITEGKNNTNEIILEYNKINFLSIIFILLIIASTIYVAVRNKQLIKNKNNNINMRAF